MIEAFAYFLLSVFSGLILLAFFSALIVFSYRNKLYYLNRKYSNLEEYFTSLLMIPNKHYINTLKPISLIINDDKPVSREENSALKKYKFFFLLLFFSILFIFYLMVITLIFLLARGMI